MACVGTTTGTSRALGVPTTATPVRGVMANTAINVRTIAIVHLEIATRTSIKAD